jgi:hypothetical protein
MGASCLETRTAIRFRHNIFTRTLFPVADFQTERYFLTFIGVEGKRDICIR